MKADLYMEAISSQMKITCKIIQMLEATLIKNFGENTISKLSNPWIVE
jgi:hypothetical protein